MWSQENKNGLLRHLPQALLFDSFGSSEAVGLGAYVSAKGAEQQTAKFMITENNAVFRDDGSRVEPGSDGARDRAHRAAQPARLAARRGASAIGLAATVARLRVVVLHVSPLVPRLAFASHCARPSL